VGDSDGSDGPDGVATAPGALAKTTASATIRVAITVRGGRDTPGVLSGFRQVSCPGSSPCRESWQSLPGQHNGFDLGVESWS